MESKIEQSDNGVVKLGQMGDVNFPMDDAGRTFHIQCKRGESNSKESGEISLSVLNQEFFIVCNRIITVGSLDRGEILCSMLDKVLKIIRSKRGFVVFTGIYKDAYISIVVSQMGGPNMYVLFLSKFYFALLNFLLRLRDFVVREVKAVVDGDIAIFRLGSCGAMHPSAPVGSLVISSKGSLFCSTNYDALYCGSNAELYKVSGPVLPDEELNSHVIHIFQLH